MIGPKINRGKYCDCHLRIKNCRDQRGKDPTCRKWLPNDYRKQETYVRTNICGGAYGRSNYDNYDYYYCNYYYYW